MSLVSSSILYLHILYKKIVFSELGRKRRGSKPCHFEKGSASVARKVLQSLEQLNLIEQHPNG